MNIEYQRMFLPITASLRDVIQLFESNFEQFALISNNAAVLAGVVTDGDIRRAIFAGKKLETSVSAIMTTHPIVAGQLSTSAEIEDLFRTHRLRYLPVVNASNEVVAVLDEAALRESVRPKCTVVLMAGGKGLRLRPLTDNVPKPMLLVGGKPILEIMLRNLVAQGFRRFLISINYLGHLIREHFGDGSKFGAEIGYIEESTPMGTAGSLALIDPVPEEPILVINGDIVSGIDFRSLLRDHQRAASDVTICVREEAIEIPYGVVRLDERDGVANVTRIDEKPTVSAQINTGIYVLQPHCLEDIAKGQYLSMPDFIDGVLQKQWRVRAFSIFEKWVDIGLPETFEQVSIGAARR